MTDILTVQSVNYQQAHQMPEYDEAVELKQLTSIHGICVWIPQFPLRSEERRKPDLVGQPVAILSPDDRRRVWIVSRSARDHGVLEGMTVSQAIGLCGALTLLEPDPVHYDEQFSGIIAALGNLSPVVEPVEPGQALVGVDGLDRLVGPPMRQLRIVARLVRWAGLQLGWGPGRFVARAAATRARPRRPVIVTEPERLPFLTSQSVTVLPVGRDTHRRLWQLGLKTLGDVARLPEAALVSQFGREGGLAWQLATGRLVEPVIGREIPEPIGASVDFPVPIADVFTLEYALDTLVGRALRHPRRVGWRVHAVRMRAALEHGSSWLRDVVLKDPTAVRTHLHEVLCQRLELAPPPGAVEQLTVELTGFVRGTTELQFFARDAGSAARTGRRRALRWAAREIRSRLKQPLLHHVIEVHPWSRVPERRYALIDYDP